MNARYLFRFTNLALAGLFACAAFAASAQQEAGNRPFKTHAQLHAAPPAQSPHSGILSPARSEVTPLHTNPQPVPKHVPAQAKPHKPLVMHKQGPSHGVSPIARQRPHAYTAKRRTPLAPTGPGPTHTKTSATHRNHARH